ncbi:MAG: electron transfer flavoprotein subunit beta/FixA family protein [Oscillospiraceae bacterium]|nr:electron transfer flavoprotein subunit beta/FixA family protein [Oscillospiraceae bacterium]
MKILVCIKQVPGSNNVEVDPVTGVLKRSGIAGKCNPYDLYAIETALSLAERFGGTVETLTMGPPQAKAVIQEAVCMGAKSGTVLTDRKFAGADVLATAYTISQGIRKCGTYDLIICGKQTTDGDTAQVGAEMAEYLGIPNISNVLHVEEYSGGQLKLRVNLDNKIVTLTAPLPCLISVDSDINTPRLPSYKIRKTLTDDSVRFLTFADFEDQNPDHYGLSGSATQVERIFPPEKLSSKYAIEGDAEAQSQALYDLLLDKKLL